MYVCLCHSVTDTDIRRHVQVDGVCTMRDLCRKTGVATQCGKCGRCAKEVFREAVNETRKTISFPAMAAA